MQNDIKAFDPLWSKYNGNEEVVIMSVKREISNILNSYVGWYDPFCELIQNALDAVDKRRELNDGFEAKIHVLIDIKNNKISVTDNGIGFKEAEYLKFLAPNFSFKSGGTTRGHKGVGTTYLAYGFNYIQIATKTPDFSATGVMKDARHWLADLAPSSNPQVVPDTNEVEDSFFTQIDRGTSMTIKCDSESYPKDLSWMGLATADAWLKVLRVQTGLGQISLSGNVKVVVEVLDKVGAQTTATIDNPKYLSFSQSFPNISCKEKKFHGQIRFFCISSNETSNDFFFVLSAQCSNGGKQIQTFRASRSVCNCAVFCCSHIGFLFYVFQHNDPPFLIRTRHHIKRG